MGKERRGEENTLGMEKQVDWMVGYEAKARFSRMDKIFIGREVDGKGD